MALTNKLQKIVDAPVFEWLRFAPTATSATSGLCVTDDAGSRYLYYLTGSSFFRYDTYSDSWQTLASPNIAPVTGVALKYSKFSGYRGTTIAATSSTITLAGLRGNVLVGNKIRIVGGTGAGQERTIQSIADSVIGDFGIVTAASAASIADSTKRWVTNQWEGYQVRIVHNTGQSQVRKVLYNDTTTLYFNDVNYQQIDSFNNTGFSAVAPYAVPVNTAGSQAHYVIEISVATVDTTWTVTPDNSSKYIVVGGGIFLFSSAAAAPFSSFQWYDILSDTWYTRTAMGGQLLAAFGTDFALDRTGEVGGAFVTGTSSGVGTTRTLVNSGASMEIDRYAGYQLRITGGVGIGQRRRIIANNATTFWVERNWELNPDATSTYSVFGDTDKIWLFGGGNSSLAQYSIEADMWSYGPISDFGLARNASAQVYGASSTGVPGEEPIAITSIVRATGGLLTVGINTAGTGYIVGELITCGTAKVWVTSVGTSGAVTGIKIAQTGSGFTNGGTQAQTATNGSGTGFILTTTTTGPVGTITTALNHNIQDGHNITLSGFATDTTWNGNFTVLGTDSLTTLYVSAPSSTGSPTIASSQSTTVLVDASQSWITNEHVGKIIAINTAGPSPTTQLRRITSNTATTINVTTAITAATNGTSRYLIQGIQGFGPAKINKIANKDNVGFATSASATTIVDSTRNWNNNQWLNHRVRVMSGTSVGSEAAITGNTATTLTVASWPNGTPDTTSKYLIYESYGIATSGALNTINDTAKNWTVNILSGKRVRITAGTLAGTEAVITANTATSITSAVGTPDATSTYVVYDPTPRSTGTSLNWIFGNTNTSNKGRWLISSRGGASNCFDIYDIPRNRWDIVPFFSAQTETLTTGSMYSYDGADKLYFTKDATGRIFSLNLNTFLIDACTTTPYAQGAAIIGNRMEIITTEDGLQYLYVMRHTGQEMWRTLVFW